MNALVAEPKEQVAPAEQGPAQAPEQIQAQPRACANCGAPMADAQDWCLECGAGVPDRTGRTPGWRSATAIIGFTVLLAAVAVAASYAALNKSTKKAAATPLALVHPATPAPATPAPATPAPSATTPPATPPAAAHPVKPATPPPKITAKAPTPAPAAPPPTKATTTPAPAATPTPTPTHTTSSGTAPANTGTPTGKQNAPGTPIVFDSNAGSNYNPYGYNLQFGDPFNAIDGDPTTAWSVSTDPTSAPHMAVGLALDLKNPQFLTRIKLTTDTPGFEFEVYGSNANPEPPSITDPGWVGLKSSLIAKRRFEFKLRSAGQRFRQLLIWITKAPPTPAGGKPATHVDLNEIVAIA